LHIWLFYVANNRLPTVININVLDANVLLAAVTKPSKHFDLDRIGSDQPSRGRAKRRHSLLTPMSASEPGENRHGGRVRACHLDGERSLYLVLRGGGLNHGERSIQGGF